MIAAGSFEKECMERAKIAEDLELELITIIPFQTEHCFFLLNSLYNLI